MEQAAHRRRTDDRGEAHQAAQHALQLALAVDRHAAEQPLHGRGGEAAEREGQQRADQPE
ncbi:hypothetical protein P4110_10185 [Pseudomonas aeruginosa]|nr:hypothetical protein [Pseudomonas aeruginosa]